MIEFLKVLERLRDVTFDSIKNIVPDEIWFLSCSLVAIQDVSLVWEPKYRLPLIYFVWKRGMRESMTWSWSEMDESKSVQMEQWFVWELLKGRDFVGKTVDDVAREYKPVLDLKDHSDYRNPKISIYLENVWNVEPVKIVARSNGNQVEALKKLSKILSFMPNVSSLDYRSPVSRNHKNEYCSKQWDYSACFKWDQVLYAQKLIALSTHYALNPRQAAWIEQYATEYNIIIHCLPSQSSFVQMISNDSNVTLSFLKNLVRLNLHEPYLEIISNLPITFKTINFVQRLLQWMSENHYNSVEFLRKFVSNLLHACERKDEATGRMVKMACAFFEHALSLNLLDQRYTIELETFCLQNSRIKEASDLYRRLKNK